MGSRSSTRRPTIATSTRRGSRRPTTGKAAAPTHGTRAVLRRQPFRSAGPSAPPDQDRPVIVRLHRFRAYGRNCRADDWAFTCGTRDRSKQPALFAWGGHKLLVHGGLGTVGFKLGPRVASLTSPPSTQKVACARGPILTPSHSPYPTPNAVGSLRQHQGVAKLFTPWDPVVADEITFTSPAAAPSDGNPSKRDTLRGGTKRGQYHLCHRRSVAGVHVTSATSRVLVCAGAEPTRAAGIALPARGPAGLQSGTRSRLCCSRCNRDSTASY